MPRTRSPRFTAGAAPPATNPAPIDGLLERGQARTHSAWHSPVTATLLHMERVEVSAYRRAAACQAYAEDLFPHEPCEPVVRFPSTPAGVPAADPAVAAAYVALSLGDGAPLTVVKSAYRTLAGRWHPDVGGSVRAMTRLNQAYDMLCRHFASA